MTERKPHQMTDLDLTGWTPHDGHTFPPALAATTIVIPLFRGTAEAGPHEGGMISAMLLDWLHAPAEPNYTPTAMDVLTGRAPKLPSADIIAWREPSAKAHEDQEPVARYPHVRADIGA